MFTSNLCRKNAIIFIVSLLSLAIVGCSNPFRATDQAVVINTGVSTTIFTKVFDGAFGQEADYGQVTFNVTATPSFGTLIGTLPNVVYVPNVDFLAGSDSFTYTASKGSLSSDATVYITMTDRYVSHLEIDNSYVFSGQAVGNHAYLAAGLGGLQIVDFLNQVAPTVIGSYDPVESIISTITELAVSNNVAYLVDIASGIISVDVTVPQSPVFMNNFDGNIRGGSVAVLEDGGSTYVYSASTGEGLYVLDGSLTELAHFPNIKGGGIHIMGETAYINGLGGITKLDLNIADRTNPLVLGTTENDPGYEVGSISDLIPLDENRVYFTGNVFDAGYTVFTSFGLMDLTDINTVTISQQASAVNSGFSVAISKNTGSGDAYAFVLDRLVAAETGGNIPTIKVMDVTDTVSTGVGWPVTEQIITPGIQPLAPPSLAGHGGPWQSFATDNGLIIVGDGFRGITIFDGN
ncbi:MAG: hypothetical protein JKY67_20960 [Pseudomonadales bacterium]|nr:hypothetical protein [Pseudomonadales bacterium]